jgi:hypothetical protein
MLKKHVSHFLTGNKRVAIIFVLIFLSSIFFGVTVKLVSMYRHLQATKLSGKVEMDLSNNGEPTTSKYGKRVSELAAVPSGEVPVEAVIANIDSIKSKNPNFYTNAQNGDVLVLYNSLAIIYSPSKDKIVAMMGFKSSQSNQSNGPTPNPEQTLSPKPTAVSASKSANPASE